MFFTYHGRLNRKPYILRGLLVYVLVMIVNIVMGVLSESDSTALLLIAILLFPVILVGCVASIMLTIRRWHDLGQSGWFTLLGMIPFVNIFVAIYLCVKKGTDGPNAYGADPLAYRG